MIAAADVDGHDFGSIYKVRFLDKTGAEIAVYNPKNRPEQTRRVILDEGQYFIGVYGSYGARDSNLCSLGLIIKETELL